MQQRPRLTAGLRAFSRTVPVTQRDTDDEHHLELASGSLPWPDQLELGRVIRQEQERQERAVPGLARRSASAWMLRNEDRTAASHAAATRPAHHCPTMPKSVPSSPE
jgi:hypothetical protein